MVEPAVALDSWINTNLDRAKWIRVDATTGIQYRYNSSTGEFDLPIPVPTHVTSHEYQGGDKITQLGTVHFRENVFAGVGEDTKGVTEDIVLPQGTLIIKKGIITKWTPA